MLQSMNREYPGELVLPKYYLFDKNTNVLKRLKSGLFSQIESFG